MNKSIARLFVVVILMFALLVVWTSRWTVFDATALSTDYPSENKIAAFESWKVKRGRILADDGSVLARSVPAGGGTWKRAYPSGSLAAQPVGYADIRFGEEAGLELQWLPQLEARQQTTLSSVFGPISQTDVGNDVDTSIDPKAQALARSLLAGRDGSVVAIVPQTGAIPVMYSNPSYDDNHPQAKCPADQLGVGCLTDLATQGEFPPGSTFKVVTSAAALDTGKYTPNSLIDGKSPLMVSSVPLENDGGESFGLIPLTEALTKSVNTVYAQVGENLGANVLEGYMKRFGFYAPPPVDLPKGSAISSGARIGSKLVGITDPRVDLGRTAIGQDKLLVTPMQMAMVAAAVADKGTLMKPHFVTKVVNPDGQVVQSVSPGVYNHVMKPSVAGELAQMMQHVVEEGTGRSANLEGLHVAGKTGTATISGTGNAAIDDAWFIGFAPVSDPKIAVAVVLPHIPNGFGGTYAAPVAAQIMKQLLAEGL